jgi:hypothetical protein
MYIFVHNSIVLLQINQVNLKNQQLCTKLEKNPEKVGTDA